MKQKLDHIPERVTSFTISNSQEFYEIQIPRSTGVNGGMATSVNINAGCTHDASCSRDHQKQTKPNNDKLKGAQCSLVATPKKRTPRTSQYDDLLSGPAGRSSMSSASQDNDDDVSPRFLLYQFPSY
jgi:hypothetical protein